MYTRNLLWLVSLVSAAPLYAADVPANTPLAPQQVFRYNNHSDPGTLDPQKVEENTAAQIVKKAVTEKADMIGLSGLITPSLEEMADAARINVESGAQIIDINMGCPAKKVNRKLAGSALLQYPDVVKSILTEVVNAVDVPVTLKIRTGWAPEHRNCEEIAQLAEDCGIQALTIHGRTRACLFNGEAEYDSIRAVKQKVSIPIIANGDITDPLKARAVLDYTGADALMIGRAAQGRPWIFREIQHYLDTGELLPPLPLAEVKRLLCAHVRELHDFYGQAKGYRIARKHVSWYLQEHAPDDQFRRTFNAIEDASEQLEALEAYFENFA